MKNLDLFTGSGRIRHGLEDLLAVWEQSADEWDDQVRQRFFEQRIEPILPIVKNALDGINRMQALLGQAQRDMER